MSASKMRTVQERAVAVIQADDWFDGVSVIADTPGDIQTQLDEALAKLGIGIVCMIAPSEPITSGNKVALRLHLAFMITENVVFNRDTLSGGSGKTAEEMVERLIPLLHNASNGAGNGRVPCVFKISSPAFQRVDDAEYFIFRVNFETEIPLQ